MLKRKPPAQLELFVAGPLEQLVPDDHVLARVDRVLDLSWLHEEVADCYCANNGRPGIDPEVAVRLMLAGLLLGFVHDRRLMREAQADIAIRWFIGCGLDERLPDHSSLTRIRQRWGEARFRKIFRRAVSACVDAGIAKGEVVHVDATLIRADAGWKSMVDRHAEAVASGNGDAAAEEGATDGEGRKADARPAGKRKKAGKTDGDASLATSRVPLRRFRYDAKHDIMKCPRGKVLRPGKPRKHGRFFHAKAKDCARCPLKGDCLSKQSRCRTVIIGDDYPALRRGVGNMKIQSCPTAAAINLKRLAAAFHARFPASGLIRMREMLVSAAPARWAGRIRQMRTEFA